MNLESPKVRRITKVWAENYKSIAALELQLSPLTVLVGPNAAGKSNIADIPNFVSHATNDGLASALSRRGYSALNHEQDRPMVLGIAVEVDETTVEYEFSLLVKPQGEYRIEREVLRLNGSMFMEIRSNSLITPESQQLTGVVDMMTRDGDKLVIPRTWPFLGNMLIQEEPLQVTISADNPSTLAIAETINAIGDVRSYRIFPNELKGPQQHSSKHPLAEDGSNLAVVLHSMRAEHPDKFHALLDTLGLLVPTIVDLAVKLVSRHLYIEFTHQTKDGLQTTVLDASQESDGTLRLLGLLAALYQDPLPSLVVIEEPELTIHPGALAIVAELMVEAADRTSLLVTTHSTDLLDGLPVECIRAVESIDGVTEAGEVAEHQRASVRDYLFTPGELLRIEGLQIER